MKKMKKVICIVGIIVLLSAMMVITPAAAKTIYVNETGWWIEGGEFNASSCPVDDAIDDDLNEQLPYSLEDGDTIFVYNGTYLCCYTDNDPVSIRKSITLKGEGADVVTFDLTGYNIYGEPSGSPNYIGISGAGGVIVDGFKIVNSTRGIRSSAPDCIIRNCVFDGLTGSTYGVQIQGDNTTFMNNVIRDSTQSYGILVVASVANVIIVNNSIIDNPGATALMYWAANCTFARNNFSSNGEDILLYDPGPDHKFYLNNFIDNSVKRTWGWTGEFEGFWNSTEQMQYVYGGLTYTNYMGNYWSDYGGTDYDGDGIGDTYYEVPDSLGVDYRPLMAGFENYPAATQCVGNCYEGTVCEGTLIGEMPCPVCLEEPGRSWKPNKDVFCFDATEPLDLCLDYCPQCCDEEDNDIDGKIDYPNDPECTCGLDPSEAPIIPVDIDIKPCTCPNTLNLKSKGVLPVAVLGTAEFDVTTIDPETILLTREGCEGVAPIRWSYEDVTTPFTGELCDCHDLDGDGYTDLTLKFYIQELVSNLKLDEVAGETIPLALTGNLKAENGGTPIEGKDCIPVL